MPGPRSASALGALLCAALVLTGCRSASEHTELAEDSADVTVVGNIPTAPPRGGDAGGLSSGANELLAQLDGIREERDLCAILSGRAFDGLIGTDVDAAALVTNPAGLTRLLATLDGTFAHLVEISPPEMVPTMQTLRDVWTRVASLGPVQDVEARVNDIFAEPQVVAATQMLLTWAPANCAAAGR